MVDNPGIKKSISKEAVLKIIESKTQDPPMTDEDIAEQIGHGRATVGRYWKKYKNGEHIKQLEDDYEAEEQVEQQKEEQDVVKDVEELDEIANSVTDIIGSSEPIINEMDRNESVDSEASKVKLDNDVEDHNLITEENNVPSIVSEQKQIDNNLIKNNDILEESAAKTLPASDIKAIYDAIGQKDIALALFSESRRYGYLNFPQWVVEHLLPWWDIKIKLEDFWSCKFTPQEFVDMLKGLLMQSGNNVKLQQELAQAQTDYSKVSLEYDALKGAIAQQLGGLKVDT